MQQRPTVYIVSGFMRSGTSAMMRCLEAGGLPAVYDERKDKMMEKLSDKDYQMNPHFYELLPKDFHDLSFLQKCAGKVVKMLAPGLIRLPHGPIYRIVFMLRHPIEIHASHNAAYEQKMNVASAFGDPPAAYPPSPTMYYYTASRVIKEQRNAGRFVATVGARSMVKRPMRTFTRLANEYGWPIEPFLAASAIEPERLRVKLEDLTVRDYDWERQKDQSPYENFGGAWPIMPRPVQLMSRR